MEELDFLEVFVIGFSTPSFEHRLLVLTDACLPVGSALVATTGFEINWLEFITVLEAATRFPLFDCPSGEEVD